MKKTYISSLMVALMAGTTAVQAQNVDDEFAGLFEEAAPEAASVAMSQASAEASATECSAAVQPKTVQEILDQGLELYAAGKYEDAQGTFKVVLGQDRYNKTAMKFLDLCAAKIKANETELRRITRVERMADVEGEWTPSYAGSVPVIDESDVAVETPEDLAKKQMEARLKGIEIPIMDFRDASIQNVALYLAEATRRDGGDGINMILLGLQGSDSVDGGSTGSGITISIRKMSLHESLNAICEMANLRFEVAPKAVYIMPYDYVRAVDLVEEVVKVSKSVGEKLAEYAAPSEGGGMDEMDSLFGESSAPVAASGPVVLADYLKSAGIACPQRSIATYYADSGTVVLKNTAENIKKIKEKLEAIQDEIYFNASKQVEIEAKFVEFCDGAYEEVGFDWNVFGSGSVLGFELADSAAGFGSSVASTLTVTDNALSDTLKAVTGGQNVFGTSYRSGTDAFQAVSSGILSSMGTDSLPSMIFSNGDVSTKLSMLEQEGTADILSSPKVTTMSGEEAVMRVVEIHRYPQDYDVETGQRTAPIVKPEDWEDFDLGVVLRVMPDVNDNGTITMKLDPEIRKFKGFEDYAVAVNAYVLDSSYTTDQYGDGSTLFAHMPYFEIRSVSTRVTVADGHTVVMGGLMDESTETFRDQVPVLGDIPYIGRLFRHEGSRTEKKTLVIYVKASQVDVRGMSYEESELARSVSL